MHTSQSIESFPRAPSKAHGATGHHDHSLGLNDAELALKRIRLAAASRAAWTQVRR